MLQVLPPLLQLSVGGPQVASAHLNQMESSRTLTSSRTFSSSLWLARSSLRRRSYSNCSPALPGASVPPPGSPPLRLARRGLPLRLPLSRADWLPLAGCPTSRLLAPSEFRPLAVWLPSLMRVVLGPVQVRSRAVWLPSRRASLLARRFWAVLDLCAAEGTSDMCAAEGTSALCAAQGARSNLVPGVSVRERDSATGCGSVHMAGAAGWGSTELQQL